MAVTTSAIAAIVGGLVIGDSPLFRLDRMAAPPQLYVWAVLAGSLFGVGGACFTRSVAWLIERRPKDKHIMWIMPLTFAAVGLLAWPLLEILGDGDPLTATAFAATTSTLLVLLWFPPNRGGFPYAASRTGAAVFS